MLSVLEDFPTIDSSLYLELLRDNQIYNDLIKKLEEENLFSIFYPKEALEILAKYDHNWIELIPSILEALELKTPIDSGSSHMEGLPMPYQLFMKKVTNNKELFIKALTLFKNKSAKDVCQILITEKIKSYQEILKSIEIKIKTEENNINWTAFMIQKIKREELTWEQFIDQFKEGDFSVIREERTRTYLTKIYNSIKETKNWYDLENNSEALNLNEKEIKWISLQFKKIFVKGWKNWLIPILLKKGIGWDLISFSQALYWKAERACIHLITNENLTQFEKVEIAVRYKMLSLLKNCDLNLSVLDFEILCNYCQKENWIEGLEFLLEIWDKLHHRKINIKTINLPEIIKKIWMKRKGPWNNKKPTQEDINNFIENKSKFLMGVLIKIDWEEEKIDPFDYQEIF